MEIHDPAIKSFKTKTTIELKKYGLFIINN